jgi:hypothetical protein
MANFRESIAPKRNGSTYQCCEGWKGYCPQHVQFLDCETLYWWLGRSKADRDES